MSLSWVLLMQYAIMLNVVMVSIIKDLLTQLRQVCYKRNIYKSIKHNNYTGLLQTRDD